MNTKLRKKNRPLLSKNSKFGFLLNRPGHPGPLSKNSKFRFLLNKVVLSGFCRLFCKGAEGNQIHPLNGPGRPLDGRDVRWTGAVSAGRAGCPVDGRGVRWTGEVSAGRWECLLDGVRWTLDVSAGRSYCPCSAKSRCCMFCWNFWLSAADRSCPLSARPQIKLTFCNFPKICPQPLWRIRTLNRYMFDDVVKLWNGPSGPVSIAIR